MLAETDQREFRRVLGKWPTGVAIVSAISAGAPTGFACNSLVSISLEPQLVGFFVAETSTTWPAIRDTGRFAVNFLSEEQEHLSRTFSDRRADRFADIAWTPGAAGPHIDGSVAWLDCQLFDELRVGDHTLAVGLVTSLSEGREGRSLLFHSGRYAAV